jgi:hypothetical protein
MTKINLVLCLGLAMFLGTTAANAGTIQTYGEVTSGAPGTYTLTSDPTNVGYAGLYYDYSASPIQLSNITNLSATFQMTQGTISGGAPRFSIIDTTSNILNEAYVFFGTPTGALSFTDPNPGTTENTGNYASLSSPDVRVQVNGFNRDSTGAAYETWAQFVAADGSADVAFVSLDVDGGFSGTQQAVISNFDVTTMASAVPEPSTWAMMILGFCGLGFMTYRRKRAGAALTAA